MAFRVLLEIVGHVTLVHRLPTSVGLAQARPNNNRKVSVLANNNNNKCGLSNIVVAAVQSQGAVIKGGLGDRGVDVMMDSGSSISLVMESLLKTVPKASHPQALS